MTVIHTLLGLVGVDMKKGSPKRSITVRLVQGPGGTWKIRKTPNSKKAEEILKGMFEAKDANERSEDPTPEISRYTSTLPVPVEVFSVASADKSAEKSLKQSYRRTIELKEDAIWSSLANITVRYALSSWLGSILNERTRKSYSLAVDELIVRGVIVPEWSLQQFGLTSPDAIIDSIKTGSFPIRDRDGKETGRQWSMRTREARIASFLAFTRYLSRRTEGLIRRGVPCRDGTGKTFSPPSRKVKSDAMTRSQIVGFLAELDDLNPRDAMIARLCLHGGKRINEVLSLETDQIDYEKKQITFAQSKSRFRDDFTVISFERPSAEALLLEMKRYIGERSGLVFVTASGKGLKQNQVDRNFMKAGRRAGIGFRVSPHNLRATAVTLWKEDGFSDSLIMKATGHSSSEMVHRYDRSEIADNVTRRSCLI
jgi:integrase